MKIQVGDAIILGGILQRIKEQNKVFPIQTSFQMYKFMKELNEVEDYAFGVMSVMFPDGKIEGDDNTAAYHSIMSSAVEVNDHGFSFNSLFELDNSITISVDDMALLDTILSKS